MKGRLVGSVAPALLATLLSIVLPTTIQAAKWPSWAMESMSTVENPRYDSENAVVLLEQWDLTLRKGTRNGSLRKVVHVSSEEGRQAAEVVLVSNPFERYDKVRVWVLSPDGRVRRLGEDDGTLHGVGQLNTLNDATVLRLLPPGVMPGVTVAFEATVRRTEDWPQDLFHVQQNFPVARFVVNLESTQEWVVSAKVANGLNPGPSQAEAEARWEFRDVSALPVGWRGLAPRPPATTLALNYDSPGTPPTFDSWHDTASWVRRLFELPDEEQPLLDAARAKVTGVEQDAVESAGKMARRLRYFALELGWGGFIPRPPEVTLQRGFGDCKDKAQVMIALLQSAGIRAYPVLAVAPSLRFVSEELPSPFVFNHVVVGIPWGDRERRPGMAVVDDSALGPLRLYDATLSESSGEDVPWMLAGGAGLLLHPETANILRFPGNDHTDNRLERHHRVRIGPDASAEVEMTLQAHGAMRRLFEGEHGGLIGPDELRSLVYRRLAQRVPEFRDLTISDAGENEQGLWGYKVEYRSDRFLADFGKLREAELDSVAPMELLPAPSEEDETIYLPLRAVLIDTYELELDGWRLADTPVDSHVENELGHLDVKFESGLQGASAKLQRAFTLVTGELPRDRFDELRELREALRGVNGMSLVLERVE